MAKRRGRGEGGLHWDKDRERWIATICIGFDARGKRMTKKASGKNKTEAQAKLKEILRDHEDGHSQGSHNYTVADAVTYWLKYGLRGRAENTINQYTSLAERHIIPQLGTRKLRELSAEDIDHWLERESLTNSTRTLNLLHSLLRRAVNKAQARDKVKRNVVVLCDVPEGTGGRPSKSLTLDQSVAVLQAAVTSPLHAYIVLSLLIGARTEELRALTWADVDVKGDPEATPPRPPSISVMRSVRMNGDTKTRKSRRRLAMPQRCVEALKSHRERLATAPADTDQVFLAEDGRPMNADGVRLLFRKVIKAAGLNPKLWTPRELRHSFVSLLSANDVPIEDISRLVGHSGTAVTETVYRHQIIPVLQKGATAMDAIFPTSTEDDSAA